MIKERIFGGRSFGSLSDGEQKKVLKHLSILSQPSLRDGDSRSLFCLGIGHKVGNRLIECGDFEDVCTLNKFQQNGVYDELQWYVGFPDEVSLVPKPIEENCLTD